MGKEETCRPTFIITWVVEAGLPVRLEVTGDVGRAEHLAADVAGDLPLVSDHVGAQTVFGGEGRGTGLGRVGAEVRHSDVEFIYSFIHLTFLHSRNHTFMSHCQLPSA